MFGVGTFTQWMLYVLEDRIVWSYFSLCTWLGKSFQMFFSSFFPGFIVIPKPSQLSQWNSSIATIILLLRDPHRAAVTRRAAPPFSLLFPSVLSVLHPGGPCTQWTCWICASTERLNRGHGLSFWFPRVFIWFILFSLWFSLSNASHCIIIFLLCISSLPEVWEISESRVEKQSSLNSRRTSTPRSLLIVLFSPSFIRNRSDPRC